MAGTVQSFHLAWKYYYITISFMAAGVLFLEFLSLMKLSLCVMINICFERNIKIYEFIFRLFNDGDILRLRIIAWVK